jgi:hypothetical protein
VLPQMLTGLLPGAGVSRITNHHPKGNQPNVERSMFSVYLVQATVKT